jgi:calcium-dependent protein kinase
MNLAKDAISTVMNNKTPRSKEGTSLGFKPVDISDEKTKYATTSIKMVDLDDDKKEDTIKISKSKFIHSGNPGVINDLYHVGNQLGQTGTVRKAVHKLTKQSRAVKIIKKQEQDAGKFHNEVNMLSKMSHPNIVQIYEFFEDKTNFYIISEFCAGGELFEKITEKGMFGEKDAAYIVKQILSAVCYLHNNNVVHRDIKPENILLEDKSDRPIIKLIDFGLARYNGGSKVKKITGSPYYLSPEAIKGIYDQKSDIWAVGVILYIMLCGYPPFTGDNKFDILKSVQKGKFDFPKDEWSSISEDAKELVKKMLTFNRSERFSAEECLAHKLFKKIRKYRQKGTAC